MIYFVSRFMQDYKKNTPIKVPRFEESNGFYTTNKRSLIMSKIKGENTSAEKLLAKALWHSGIRYRKYCKNLPGKPDLVNKKLKLAIFVDGEFWHGYAWESKKAKIKSNRAFWIPKIERNMQRDVEVNAMLKTKGFRVFRFWEREVKYELGTCVKQVLDYVHLKIKYPTNTNTH